MFCAGVLLGCVRGRFLFFGSATLGIENRTLLGGFVGGTGLMVESAGVVGALVGAARVLAGGLGVAARLVGDVALPVAFRDELIALLFNGFDSLRAGVGRCREVLAASVGPPVQEVGTGGASAAMRNGVLACESGGVALAHGGLFVLCAGSYGPLPVPGRAVGYHDESGRAGQIRRLDVSGIGHHSDRRAGAGFEIGEVGIGVGQACWVGNDNTAGDFGVVGYEFAPVLGVGDVVLDPLQPGDRADAVAVECGDDRDDVRPRCGSAGLVEMHQFFAGSLGGGLVAGGAVVGRRARRCRPASARAGFRWSYFAGPPRRCSIPGRAATLSRSSSKF